MEVRNHGLQDYEVIAIIAHDISQSKYIIANKKICEKVNAGYFKKEEIATAEAFYTEFKNFGMTEVESILKANEIIAKDGQFITREGLQIEYDKVLRAVIDTKNIEQYVDRFLSSNFGDDLAKGYAKNLQAQKDFTMEMYTSFFDNNGTEPTHSAVKAIPLFNIYDAVKHSIPKNTIMETAYSANAKFGVPKFQLSRDGVTAEFSSGVEVKHMLTDPDVIQAIKYKIANPPVTEDLQEDVWLRNQQNVKPNLLRQPSEPNKRQPENTNTLSMKNKQKNRI